MIRPKLFLVGSGVGRDLRGFESHLLDLYDAIKDEPGFDTFLVKAAGEKNPRHIRVASLHRNTWPAALLGLLIGRNSYAIQNLTFFFCLVFSIYQHRPHTIYLGEPQLFHYLFRWRRLFGMKYRLLFYTGGNTVPVKVGPEDLIQLVTPSLMDRAIARGARADQIEVIPFFIANRGLSDPVLRDKDTLRAELGLPLGATIVLSVGAIDNSVKRMNYVINEVSLFSFPVYLVMLGEHERETPAVNDIAHRLLGPQGYCLRRVPRDQLTKYYAAADLFVLASLDEGFGMVYIEALMHGLPVLTHHHAAAKFVLGELGTLADLSVEGNLATSIQSAVPALHDVGLAEKRRSYCLNRFGWSVVRADYIRMFKRCMT